MRGDEFPVRFWDKNVWYRGWLTYLYNGEKAYLIDYKTSKTANYADTKQLDLQAVFETSPS